MIPAHGNHRDCPSSPLKPMTSDTTQAQPTESLTLKWGTLKAWKVNEGSPAHAALQRYAAGGMNVSAATQSDTPEQKQAILDLIDALNADTVYLDWDGKQVPKEEAKQYITDYRR